MYFDDPADLARLPAVSSAMRDTMAGAGLAFEELNEEDAAYLGCLSAVQRMQRQGRLSHREYLTEAAAIGGDLEESKVLRENGCLWDWDACAAAACGGHLVVLQLLHANDCPWDSCTCTGAARCGNLKVLQWARANGCPWDSDTCAVAALSGHLEVLQWPHANG